MVDFLLMDKPFICPNLVKYITMVSTSNCEEHISFCLDPKWNFMMGFPRWISSTGITIEYMKGFKGKYWCCDIEGGLYHPNELAMFPPRGNGWLINERTTSDG